MLFKMSPRNLFCHSLFRIYQGTDRTYYEFEYINAVKSTKTAENTPKIPLGSPGKYEFVIYELFYPENGEISFTFENSIFGQKGNFSVLSAVFLSGKTERQIKSYT